jgi:hypothetical protein
MSKYTTELRFICEELAGLDESVGYNDVNTVISTALPKLFSFNFPIFDEAYRTVLETKIVKHFYTREIGFESFGLFKLKLDTKLNEIMPYYNTLYANQLKVINKLDSNVNLTEEFTRNIDNETTGSSSSNGNSKTLFQDTPQGYLVQATMEQMDHATNINFGKNSDETSSNTTGTSTEDYIKTITGNNGSKYNVEVLNEIKNNLLNIDMMIINDLSDLFMGIL